MTTDRETQRSQKISSAFTLLIASGNANAEECPGLMWTVIMSGYKGTGQNHQELICFLSDWKDCPIFLAVWQRAWLKRIITSPSSVSMCKMTKVHMQGSWSCPNGCDPVLGYSQNDSLTETTQLKVPGRSTNLQLPNISAHPRLGHIQNPKLPLLWLFWVTGYTQGGG